MTDVYGKLPFDCEEVLRDMQVERAQDFLQYNASEVFGLAYTRDESVDIHTFAVNIT